MYVKKTIAWHTVSQLIKTNYIEKILAACRGKKTKYRSKNVWMIMEFLQETKQESNR
jgi:hypothetical protein